MTLVLVDKKTRTQVRVITEWRNEMSASHPATQERVKKEEKPLAEPEVIDFWHPTVKQVKGKTLEEKLVFIDEIIDTASSDTQFAAKMKAALRYILIDAENMPDVDAPGAQTTKPHEGVKTAEQLKQEEEAKKKTLESKK